jgi:bifunctional non-homologous end joining protein LigD
MNRPATDEEIRIGRRTVHISRPEKLLFPAEEIDKLQLAEYYGRIASAMFCRIFVIDQ